MRNKAGMKFDCIFEEPLDFIDIDYTHLNKTVRYEKRPHGEWIFQKYDHDYKCSHCHIRFDEEEMLLCDSTLFRFCPNCGADMRGKNDE